MSSHRPDSSQSATEFLNDDCNACDLLGATAKNLLGPGNPSRSPKNSNHKTPLSFPPPPNTPKPETPNAQKDTLDKDSEPFWPKRPAPGIVEIGNAGWTTLHTFAAYYPDHPSKSQETSANNLINAFVDLFPCRWCADDLKSHVEKNPVRTESREAFSKWTCDAHNHVNEELGKPLFDCNLFDQYWRRHKQS